MVGNLRQRFHKLAYTLIHNNDKLVHDTNIHVLETNPNVRAA
jgi:hypothetical protein